MQNCPSKKPKPKRKRKVASRRANCKVKPFGFLKKIFLSSLRSKRVFFPKNLACRSVHANCFAFLFSFSGFLFSGASCVRRAAFRTLPPSRRRRTCPRTAPDPRPRTWFRFHSPLTKSTPPRTCRRLFLMARRFRQATDEPAPPCHRSAVGEVRPNVPPSMGHPLRNQAKKRKTFLVGFGRVRNKIRFSLSVNKKADSHKMAIGSR